MWHSRSHTHTHTHTYTQTLPFGIKIMLATLCQCRSNHLRDRALLTADDHDSMLERGHRCRVDTHQATSFACHSLIGGLLNLRLLHRLGGEAIVWERMCATLLKCTSRYLLPSLSLPLPHSLPLPPLSLLPSPSSHSPFVLPTLFRRGGGWPWLSTVVIEMTQLQTRCGQKWSNHNHPIITSTTSSLKPYKQHTQGLIDL